MHLRTVLTVCLGNTVCLSQAALDLSWGDDSDLTSFVTRPEIKVPTFDVTVHEPSKVTPGYFFVAPYAFISQQPHARRYYQACQTGPTIYDHKGELVWTGACKFRNQNACDFRAWNFNDTVYTSSILTTYAGVKDARGHGVFMDSSFQNIQDIQAPPEVNHFNMHELNLVEDGRSALQILYRPSEMDVSGIYGRRAGEKAWVADVGFIEVELATQTTLFEWWAVLSGRVELTESDLPMDNTTDSSRHAWDWFHGNSVEKNVEGDYLLSSRHTNTIYKISGKTGDIVWRLGGRNSSFFQDFEFARQHDARWVSVSQNKEVISFLNNGADENTEYMPRSSALVVELDTLKGTAKVLKSLFRPDNGLTRLRGNHQLLSNGNSLVCWSENSYMSEYDLEGNLLMEARHRSWRFITYRGYKFNFTGVSDEPIAVKASAYGSLRRKSTTVVHVSWNGATEVVSWRLKNDRGALLGEKTKSGFETSFHIDGFHPEVIAEAISRNGSIIGASTQTPTSEPVEWRVEVLDNARIDSSKGLAHVEQAQPLFSVFENWPYLSRGLVLWLFATVIVHLCISLCIRTRRAKPNEVELV